MIGINGDAFAREGTWERAGGIQPIGLPNGGIIDPEEFTIPAGTRLIRFGGFPKHRDRDTGEIKDGGAQYFGPHVSSGEWWLSHYEFEKIEKYSNGIGESLTYAVRETCAVPDEWSDMSFLVRAATRSPLVGYRGFGRPVNIRDEKSGRITTRINPSAGHKPLIKQWFFPGLNAPDLRKRAIFVGECKFLDSAMSKKGARREAELDAAMRARLSAASRR